MKLLIRYIVILLLIGGLLAIFQTQYAQEQKKNEAYSKKAQMEPYLKQIASVLNNSMLSYEYSITLFDEQQRATTDSLGGRLYKINDNFCDSSNSSICLLSDGYFCKIDNTNKSALICNMEKLQQQLGIQKEDINANLISVTDSMLETIGSLSMHEEEGYVQIKYILDMNQSDLQTVLFRIDKAVQKIDKIIITMNETPMGKEFSKQLIIFNISNTDVTNCIKPDNYFRIIENKVTLNNKYKGYKLKAAI